MAQALPTGGASTGTTRPPGRTRPGLPDVFDERTHKVARWAAPLVLGLVYGYWAASIRRHGGPITGWNLLFGFLTVLAFVVLYAVVRAVAQRLPREGHAVLWGAFAGSALGFLYAQSGVAMFTCIVVSLLFAAAVFAALFYRYYTHEDAAGRPAT
ncbi:hypothetical protein [Streptomyces lancefieldiae]|uniref:Integral membrane protein n=1 Tax=Streptomyces lancefieldiae TaxID=3075520 RepID=A0ABU3AUL9_9ACTN|nr:hypothetical protein [Streptomyces sp. DSM 40712]MDT0613292.1 hypothetical protein [Streptomyces sp. DSM 40712]